MESTETILYRLRELEGLEIREKAPLSGYSRFGVGGPARLVAEADRAESFVEALQLVRHSGVRWLVLGGGTNIVPADEGFDGVVLRFLGTRIWREAGAVRAESGAALQSMVDFTIEEGLAGMHTLTRIPGWVGGAVHGNAGAYGRSIMEFVRRVEYVDAGGAQWLDKAGCEFDYRESVFKRRKDWAIISVELELPGGGRDVLRRRAREIAAVRDAKFPPAMRCAGSIFKNCILARLPPAVAGLVPPGAIREGKVASAWFLEQVGAKGMRRGGIQVAHYHANLIYNDGPGRAADARSLIGELKRRVEERFGLWLEEEVQYVGFPDSP